MIQYRSKTFLIVILICLSSVNLVFAQKFKKMSAVGFSIGTSNFMGDLGGSKNIGRTFLYDLDIQATRPALSVFYKYHLNPFLSFRGELMYTQLIGDDAFNPGEFFVDRSYPRRYRNLSFRSPVISFAGMAELNLYKYQPGDIYANKVAPFVGLGFGAFYFDPRTDDPLTGDRVRLQPLGTEGQGIDGYDKKYSLIQPQLLASAGVKFNAGPMLAMSIEVIYHQTFTDYLDDVSGDFVDPAIFFANYDPATAALVSRLHNRSGELGLPPDPSLIKITRPGEIRGDNTDRDQFFRVQASFMILLGAKRAKGFNMYRCPVW